MTLEARRLLKKLRPLCVRCGSSGELSTQWAWYREIPLGPMEKPPMPPKRP